MRNESSELPSEIEHQFNLITKRWQEGQLLAQQGQFEKALSKFEGCLKIATQQQLPLPLDQFVSIMMSIGFCYADMLHWDKSLEVYDRLELILRQEEDWFQYLPDGLLVAVPESYDPSLYLAALYDSMGLAYDNSDRIPQAQSYYKQAIELYLKSDQKQRAAQTWYYWGVGCQRRQDWTNLQLAGENRLSLCAEIDDVEGEISALQFLAQAHINQKEPHKTIEYLKRAVEAEKRIGHPSLAQDEKLLNELTAYAQQKKAAWTDMTPQQKLREAAQTLRDFAYSHCGPDREVIPGTKRILGGLISRQVTAEKIYWAVGIEGMYEFGPDGSQGNVMGAVLDLHQIPEALIRVTVNSPQEYMIRIMAEKKIPGVPQPALVSVISETTSASPEGLARLLNNFLQRGILVKEKNRLRYSGTGS